MPLYRAVPREGFEPGKETFRHPGRRLPGNIPYLVDNLWDLTRPDTMPSRRHAVYASPTPELALQNASAGALERAQYVVCELEFKYEPPMIQLSVTDARKHDDVGRLQKFVNKQVGDWADADLATKLALAPLFLPGIRGDELRAAMAANPLLNDLALAASRMVKLWSEYPAKASPDGELFFEIAPDNWYKLHQV